MKNNKKVDKHQRVVVLVILIIVVIPSIILSTIDFSPHKLIIQDNTVKVGIKSFKVEDIKTVELIGDIDINHRIKGTKTLTYLRGLYSIEGESQDASVYIYRNKRPYIRIELEEGLIIYNDKNSRDTKKTYKNLVEITNLNK